MRHTKRHNNDALIAYIVIIIAVIVIATGIYLYYYRKDHSQNPGSYTPYGNIGPGSSQNPGNYVPYGVIAPMPTDPYTVTITNMLGVNIVVNTIASVTVVSLDTATGSLNPGIGVGSSVSSLTISSSGSAALTMAYPNTLSYSYSAPTGTLSADGSSIVYDNPPPSPVLWTYELVKNYTGNDGLQLYLYTGGFETELTNTLLVNYTSSDIDVYITNIQADGSISYFPVAYLNPGYSIPFSYVAAPQIIVFTYTGGSKSSSAGSSGNYIDKMGSEWPAPSQVMTNWSLLVDENATVAVYIYYSSNNLLITTGDVVFFGGDASCYSELHQTNGVDDLGVVTNILTNQIFSMLYGYYLIAASRAQLQQINSTGLGFIPYGTAVGQGLCGPSSSCDGSDGTCSLLADPSQKFFVDDTTLLYSFYGPAQSRSTDQTDVICQFPNYVDSGVCKSKLAQGRSCVNSASCLSGNCVQGSCTEPGLCPGSAATRACPSCTINGGGLTVGASCQIDQECNGNDFCNMVDPLAVNGKGRCTKQPTKIGDYCELTVGQDTCPINTSCKANFAYTPKPIPAIKSCSGPVDIIGSNWMCEPSNTPVHWSCPLNWTPIADGASEPKCIQCRQGYIFSAGKCIPDPKYPPTGKYGMCV